MTVSWDDPRQPGAIHEAVWRSENHTPPPKRMRLVDDTLTADAAYRWVSEGTGLLWQGDFHNARQLMQALARRMDRRPFKPGATLLETFHLQRQRLGQRTRQLGMVLVPLTADFRVPLRRAPLVARACEEAYGATLVAPEAADMAAAEAIHSVVSLRELQGLVGAHEWRKKGVEVPALGPGGRIHPHWGVFSPLRGEYLDLVARAPLPAGVAQGGLVLDIGTGTGVIAAVLAQRGVPHILATDLDERALACAAANLARLGCAAQVTLRQTDLFPSEPAALIVCNPPWLPAQPTSSVEAALYDPDSRMLRGFLTGLAAQLAPGGEGWLIMSDLAERIGLRADDALSGWIAAAGLRVVEQMKTRPRHGKAHDAEDPLFEARSREVTSLWRLAVV